jgi:hypothetical protein
MITDWSDLKVRRGAMNRLMAKLKADPALWQQLRTNKDVEQLLKAAGLELAPDDAKVLTAILKGEPIKVQVDLSRFAVPEPPYDDNDLWGNWPGMWAPTRTSH